MTELYAPRQEIYTVWTSERGNSVAQFYDAG